MLDQLFFSGTLLYIGDWVIRLVMMVIVPVRRPPATASGWLLLIFFFPWPGLFVYLLIGSPRLPRWRQAKIDQQSEVFANLANRFQEHPQMIQPELTPALVHAVTLARNLGRLPILTGNSTELLNDYHGTIDRLVADIEEAQVNVHLLFYIFAVDKVTQPIIDALGRAVQRGVKCRVLYDALGSRAWEKSLQKQLEDLGVEAHALLKTGLLRRKAARMDLRNHRKIAVIDGRVAYTGSQNLVDPTFKPGIMYEELMVRVTGPVVIELQYVFSSDWYLEADEILDGEDVFPDPEVTGDDSAQVLPSGPGFPMENNQRLIVSLVHGARNRVVITTPYFVPDVPLLQAMQTAVLRGVEVHLVVSMQADQLLVSLAQKSYYGQLLDAGVTIHRYTKHFLHAKHVSIDDQVAVIGSSNMDIRSFMLNAEVMTIFYDKNITSALHQIQEEYFANSEALDKAKWAERPFLAKTVEGLGRLMSPLL